MGQPGGFLGGDRRPGRGASSSGDGESEDGELSISAAGNRTRFLSCSEKVVQSDVACELVVGIVIVGRIGTFIE